MAGLLDEYIAQQNQPAPGLLGPMMQRWGRALQGPVDPLAMIRLKMLEEEHRRAQSNADREFGLRQSEIQRAQTNADRGFGLQREQFDFTRQQATEKPQIVWKKDDSDNEVPYQQMPNGTIKRLSIDGAPAAEPNNPFAMGKMNEAQSKDALYSSRMMAAEKILRDPKVTAAAQSSAAAATQKLSDYVPFGLGRGMIPENYQQFDQAKRNFINATLRRESGAVISKEEFENADKQYFPLPNDPPSVLAQKQANRADAIKGIAAGAGKGYKPPMKFDDGGNLVPNAPAVPSAPGSTKVEYDNPDIVDARKAIATGKISKQEAMRRLYKAGVKFAPGDLDLQ